MTTPSDRATRRRQKPSERPQAAVHPTLRGRRPAPPPAPETAAQMRASGRDVALLLTRAAALLAGHDEVLDLSYLELEALRYFANVGADQRAETPGGRRQLSVAGFQRYVGLSHLTTASRTIKALTDRGLISVVSEPFDGHSLRAGYSIRVTREGLEMLQKEPTVHLGRVIERDLTAEQRTALVAGIQTIVMASSERRLRISPSKK